MDEINKVATTLDGLYNAVTKELIVKCNSEILLKTTIDATAYDFDYWNTINLQKKQYDINLYQWDDKYLLTIYKVENNVRDDNEFGSVQLLITPNFLQNPTLEKLKEVWEEFGDICIDDDECIDSDFYFWKKGTDRYEIWHWFDKRCPNNLHDDLMFPK